MEHTDDQLDAFARWERQVWETRAAPYARGMVGLTAGAADALLDAAAVGGGSQVLDVATGPGVVAVAAQHRGASVVAVDQAEAMVSLARAAGVDARQAGAEQLPFTDGAFDAVVAGFLLNHLARPAAAIAELARVCRGRLALSVWDAPAANPVLGLFGSVASSVASSVVPPGPESDRFADDERFTTLLTGAGLDDVAVERVTWTFTVDPGDWFDAIAAGTPRTGAVLAAAPAEQLAALRRRYVEVATTSYGGVDGPVTLPAGALVGSGRPRR
ncbi:MAG: class I SAM-dependent methyltransferase [Acidimicrobiales bacterium]